MTALHIPFNPNNQKMSAHRLRLKSDELCIFPVDAIIPAPFLRGLKSRFQIDQRTQILPLDKVVWLDLV